MIRNVVVGRLRQPSDAGQRAADLALLQEGLAGIAALRLPGLVAMHVGTDAGLRAGGWDFAITNDWQDVGSYDVYDADTEHNRLRSEIFAVICQDIARVQFQVDDQAPACCLPRPAIRSSSILPTARQYACAATQGDRFWLPYRAV